MLLMSPAKETMGILNGEYNQSQGYGNHNCLAKSIGQVQDIVIINTQVYWGLFHY